MADDGVTPAVYTPNANLCCKGKRWGCKNPFSDWGYRIEAPSSDMCDPKANTDNSFSAQSTDIVDVSEEALSPGSPGHTVQSYCYLGAVGRSGSDGGPLVNPEESEQQLDDSIQSAAASQKAHRNEVIGALVNELSKNSLGSMAQEIVSLYVCVRWAPTEELINLAEGEMKTNQLPKSDPLVLYKRFHFIPLGCSRNVNVYEQSNDVSQTHFKVFEDTLEAISTWFGGEANGAVEAHLRALGDFSGSSLADALQAFDTNVVRAAVAKCGPAPSKSSDAIYVNTFTAPTTELLGDCAAVRWWLQHLEHWHAAMPFKSFMSPDATAAEKVLVCFGKRVASQLHRRADGDHLLTDQSAVGRHGFWDLKESGKMLHRTVQLWRPPTCQLAAMELDMKMKIMKLVADMNSRLFDALPAMLADEMADDGVEGEEVLKAAGSVGVLKGMFDSVVGKFSSLRGKYVSLGQLLGNTVVKWAVCPLKNITTDDEANRLDSVLGTEDDLARYYASEAYAKWTGETQLLPGEKCEEQGGAGIKTPRCMQCQLGVMQESMPEPYGDEDFVCPVRPLLPAKEQLEVLQKKRGLCVMHMTFPQWEHTSWRYRGYFPHVKQYNRTENAPTRTYETVKIIDFKSRPDAHFGMWHNFVTVGRRCTEDEFAATPRWCSPPKVENVPSSVSGVASVAGDALHLAGGTGGVIGKGLEAAGWKDESPPMNKLTLERVGGWFYGAGKTIERTFKTAWGRTFGQASGRYDRLYNRSFSEIEAGELLHGASFQKELAESGADSKGRQKYARYAVVCPCEAFDPNREFRLKYRWAEEAIRLASKAEQKFSGVIFKSKVFEVELQAASVLHMKNEESAWTQSSVHLHAAAAGSGTSPKTWLRTKDPFLEVLAGLTSASGTSQAESSLYGFRATFACGTRVAMHNLPVDVPPSGEGIAQTFSECVKSGVATNQALRNAAPADLFFQEEVVVRVTFSPMSTCYHERMTKDDGKPEYKPVTNSNETAKRNWYERDNSVYKAFSGAGSGCAALDSAPEIPAYLQEARGQDATYRGLMLARGLPRETLTEVLLDPGDLMAELSQL